MNDGGMSQLGRVCVVFVGLLLAPQSLLARDVIKLVPHDEALVDDRVCFDADRLHDIFKSSLGYYSSSEYKEQLRKFTSRVPREKTFFKGKAYEEGRMLSEFKRELRAEYDKVRGGGYNKETVDFLASMLNSQGEKRIWTHFGAYYEANTKLRHWQRKVTPMVYGSEHQLPQNPILTSDAAADICVEFINEVVEGRMEYSPRAKSSCGSYQLKDQWANNYDDGPRFKTLGRVASLLPNGKSNFGFSKKTFSMRRPACAGDPEQKKIAKRRCKASLVSCSGDKKQGDIPMPRVNNRSSSY